MVSRERVKCALRHKEPEDRIPIQDSLWLRTLERWRREGFPEDIPVDEYFDFDMIFIGFDGTPRFPTKILERNDKFIIQTVSTGAINKIFRGESSSSAFGVVDRPIKNKKDWPAIKERLYPDYTRVNWVWAFNAYQKARSEGKFILCGRNLSSGWGYDILQWYMRSEQLLVALVTDPDWVREMVLTLAGLFIKTVEMMIKKGFQFDGAFIFNDVGWKNGLLFSPETYRRTQKEADQMVFSFCHEHNMSVILHSCGCVKELIPDLIEVGVDCLFPLEVKAGMDVRELKQKYGDKLSFMGGIDVRAMANPDPSVIEKEIRSKIEIAKRGGGYIYHSDHSVPDNVSFKQYKRVMRLLRKYGSY